MSPILLGKNSYAAIGNLGAAGSSGGNVVLPPPPSAGTQYLLDWVNIVVRNAAAANAYLELALVVIEGPSPLLINEALVSSGAVSAGGTYSIFLQGLGIPIQANGVNNSATVTLKDNTGAASATTATNGLIIGTWGLKQYPYAGVIG